MTSPVDVCNRALAKAGTRTVISSLTDSGPAATTCALFYNDKRQQLLRSAQWGFARKTVQLGLLGQVGDVPADVPYPYLYKYAYPSDCVHMRYVLPYLPANANPNATTPPAVGTVYPYPLCGPTRQWRYIVAYDDAVDPAQKVLLTNVPYAIGVYTADVTNPDIWDGLFREALQNALAEEFIVPLSGNIKLLGNYVQLANAAVMKAQASDGNEAIASTDHIPDWMAVRFAQGYSDDGGDGVGSLGGLGGDWGTWFSGYDSMAWGA